MEKGVAELVLDFGPEDLVTGSEAERFDGLASDLAVKAKRAFDDDFPVTGGGVWKALRLRRFLEAEVGVADELDVAFREFTVLLAEVLTKGLEPLGGVNELH